MTLLSVFLLGLLGGLHCASMCGGLVTAFSFRPPSPPDSPASPTSLATTIPIVRAGATSFNAMPLYMNSGRVVTYTVLGAVAGAVSSLSWVLDNMLPVQRTLFLVSSVLLLLIGGWLMGWRAPLSWTERFGLKFWRKLQPFAAARSRSDHPGQAFLLGAIWGFVPCGMVYVVLLSALTSGSALNGAMLMAAFGLGTLPNLLLIGAGSQWLARLGGADGIRRVVAISLILMAFLGIYRAITAQPLDPSVFCLVPGGV